VADLCEAEGISFVLGHALAMKAIHGGKAKNDRIDSHEIAVLLLPGWAAPPPSLATTDALRGDVARHEEAGMRARMSF
jgi:hypothetical protein